MMAMATITFQLDRALKNQLENLLEDLGLDMDTAFTLFAREIVKQAKFPFEITAGRNAAQEIPDIEIRRAPEK